MRNCLKWLMVFLVVAVAWLMMGCNGVIMNATYSQLLDQTAATSVETAARAQDGRLSCDEMKVALDKQSQTWMQFQNAREGRADK